MGIAKGKAWFPVKSILKISNLPANITPEQLVQILSHVQRYPFGGTSGALQRVNSGITIVQIYPAAAIRECSMTSGPDRINRSKVSSSQARRATPQGPVHRIDPHAEGEDTTSHVTDQLWETTSFVQSVSSIETVVARLPTPPPAEEPEETSVAYVHFRSVSYLCQAESILEQVTVNGRKVDVRYKWWSSAPMFRVWSKVRNKL